MQSEGRAVVRWCPSHSPVMRALYNHMQLPVTETHACTCAEPARRSARLHLHAPCQGLPNPSGPSHKRPLSRAHACRSYDENLAHDDGVPSNGFPANTLQPLAGETGLCFLRVNLMHDAAEWQHLSGLTRLTTLELPHARTTFMAPPHVAPQQLLLALARQHPALLQLKMSDLAGSRELKEELLQLLPELRHPGALEMAPT
jgi:hypothetical protein